VTVTARRRALGRAGEDAAAAWYQGRGYVVLDRNWRAPGGTGELDLVAARADVVVFCEVKARSTGRYGSGLAAVDVRKQRRVRTLAVRWLAAQDRHWDRVRFDVVDVDARGHLRVVEAAF
jgi:putative endonuclease